MNNGLKLLLMAAGAIVTCIVVVVGFQLTKSGKSDTNNATEQYSKMLSEYDEVKLTAHEDTVVSGAEVITYIKDNASTLVGSEITSITITTKSGKQTYNIAESEVNATPTPAAADKTKTYSTAKGLKDAVDANQSKSTAGYYINPSGKFKCKIDRNTNGMIQTISFNQE